MLVDILNILIAAGIGFLLATLVWWSLLFWGAKTLVERMIHRRWFEYQGIRYYIQPDL